ncbi:MAG TPA: phosphodiester glycosidase family protein [Acidimicrobiia bacterium]|nr:phosphodiester glycosidase family protein [Acidimicrobiia bacterium]
MGAALAAVLLAIVVPAAAWADDRPIPAGYTVIARDTPAAGVEHLVLTRANPPMVVNVARLTAGAPVSLRAVLSNDTVAGDEPRLETTSSMCARVHCLFGVNADFAGVGDNEPLGAFVTDGALLRSPSTTHHQLSLTADGKLTDQTFGWTGKVLPITDLEPLYLDGVNVARPAGKVVLYTPAFGSSTKTEAPGVDLVVRVVEPAGEFRLGQTASVELLALNEGAQDGPIPPGGAVLSGEGAGADALRSLWSRVGTGKASRVALLRLTADTDVLESVGGSPILVKDGKRWFTDPGDNFTDGRHPRTLVGWTPGGDTLLVTVDGRQPGVSVGMSLFEATDFLIALGATEAMNLDGGGSTTFVQGGNVANKVSDVSVRSGGKTVVRHSVQQGDTLLGHVERPVASALVVVPSIAVSVPPVDPLAGVALGLHEQALALPGGSSASPSVSGALASDAASVPDGASGADGRLPALVGPRPKVATPLVRAAVLLDVLAMVALAGVGLAVRRRGGLRMSHRRPLARLGRSGDSATG